MQELGYLITTSVFIFASTFMLVRYGSVYLQRFVANHEAFYQRVLVQQLLIKINPRVAVYLTMAAVLAIALILGYLLSWVFFVLGAGLGLFLPVAVIKHLEHKRRAKLESQLVDGITTLSSGVRAGLTLIQAMELLVTNQRGPIKEEFGQMLREYQMGMDLNQAMRSTADRIGTSNYRLLFTAIEMHRVRGGDTGESLDRITESIREIQRLEGKLDAITAQGRAQAWMMAIAPIFIITIYWFIDPEGANRLISEPLGRMILLAAFLLILGAYLWIRKIMAVDI